MKDFSSSSLSESKSVTKFSKLKKFSRIFLLTLIGTNVTFQLDLSAQFESQQPNQLDSTPPQSSDPVPRESFEPSAEDINGADSFDDMDQGGAQDQPNFQDDFGNGNGASGSDFDGGQAKETAQENAFFGRGTGIKNSKLPKKENPFVNLNPETAFGPEVITSFDFPNADIMELTKHMQKLTGINLILDKDVKGKISIMAPTPITVGDAWKAYLTALNLNGYSLVKTGAFYKVIQSRDVRYSPTNIYTGTYTPDTENYVMRIISLKNVSSAEITRSFRPFMGRYGRIIDIKQTNTVIVHDTGTNINRLMKLIKFLDVPGHEESLQIIRVKNSSAQEIANLLDKILKGQGNNRMRPQTGQRDSINISKLIAEPRTNSIIAMANADGARQLRELINKLDVKLTHSRGGQIHVYYLNYGDADTLAKTLSSLVSSSLSAARSRMSARSGDSSASELFSSEVKITSDKANNAIVVMASPTDYLTIKRILAKLDIPRDQVYVEGMIMETQVSDGTDFGVSILGAYGSGNAQKAGFAPAGSGDLVNLLTNNITSLGGLFVGMGAGKKITYNNAGTEVSINSVNALIKAIATDNQTNVLATPQILALDNEEAVFEVGETVPILVREVAANGSSVTSVKEQKVALTLKITPQINKVTRVIKLKINHKIDDFSGRSTGTGEGVGTTTRQAVTTVLIRDRDTLAMGGLMRDKTTFVESKVPLLGDIPILGWLFKARSKSTSKVNLLFFLTPKILAPYDKTAAKALKDTLNRRAAHLQSVFGDEDDPFGTTAEGLFEKAKKQDEGALYDKAHVQPYLDENNNSGDPQDLSGNINDSDSNGEGDSKVETNNDKNVMSLNQPNYQKILEEIKKEKQNGKQKPEPITKSTLSSTETSSKEESKEETKEESKEEIKESESLTPVVDLTAPLPSSPFVPTGESSTAPPANNVENKEVSP
jgi:general secretion pathway protein D